MSFAYVRRYASFPLASHIIVSNSAVRVRYAVLGSPSEHLTYILSLFVETHIHLRRYIDNFMKFILCLIMCNTFHS